MLRDPAMGLLLGGAGAHEPTGGTAVGNRLGFRRPGAVQAIWRHAAYDLEGGGLFVVRSVVVSAGGIDGGAEVV